MSDSTKSSGGVGFAGLLTLIFIALKLAGVGSVASWSWWWVLSPLWIPLCLVLGVLLIVIIIKSIIS